jgi:hypothetical protein
MGDSLRVITRRNFGGDTAVCPVARIPRHLAGLELIRFAGDVGLMISRSCRSRNGGRDDAKRVRCKHGFAVRVDDSNEVIP